MRSGLVFHGARRSDVLADALAPRLSGLPPLSRFSNLLTLWPFVSSVDLRFLPATCRAEFDLD